MTDSPEILVEKVARAICAEKCAFRGEPACYRVMDDSPFTWPPETCCEPGCVAEATAALTVALEKAAQVAIDNQDCDAWEIAAAIRAMKDG